MTHGPHYTYSVSSTRGGSPAPAALAFLDLVETLIPGARLLGRLPGSSRLHRVDDILPDWRMRVEAWCIEAPINCAWLVEHWLRAYGLLAGVSASPDAIGILPWSAIPYEALVETGRGLVAAQVARGELRVEAAEKLTPYQLAGVAWGATRPFSFAVWDPGVGKTLGGTAQAFTRQGPVLVVCPGMARRVWWDQPRQYTTITPYRVFPASDRPKGWEPLADYLARCRDERRRPFVVVGLESLPDHVDDLRQLLPEVLIFDELHMLGDAKRWRPIFNSDGSKSFEKVKTSDGGERRSVAAMEVSRFATVRLRIGLTGTPLDDGRPRRLWAPLDLLDPGGVGRWGAFRQRYCGVQAGYGGHIDDKGSSNMEELKARLSFYVHRVTREEAAPYLPKLRMTVTWLDKASQNRADPFAQELKKASRAASRAAGGEALEQAEYQLREAKLAHACSQKRVYVVQRVLERLHAGQRAVVLTSRRAVAEVWAEAIGRHAPAGAWVAFAHGGLSERDRDDMIARLGETAGPCCIVGTGQSIGTSKDGLHKAHYACLGMLPVKPGELVQWLGRFPRLGGVGTEVEVVLAEDTYDDHQIGLLTDKFGPIQKLIEAPGLAELADRLESLDDPRIEASVLSKLGIGAVGASWALDDE